ncbi:hypothetical protein V8E51_006596 [Hyaloscypha variabilis]
MAKQIEILTFHPSDDIDLSSLALDIIALHGLNGNQLTTWTDPKTQALWLRDFLPKDVKARVMVFGYDAKAAFGDGVAGVKEHARGLLGALGEKRGRSFEAKRPLIFVGHSLGGLVIKQALVIAEQETLYKQIYNSTLGIIFFGTPHQGSRLANYATAITSPLLVLANKPDAELLEFLKKDNPALKQLGDQWKAHHEKRPYDIVSFYETKTMRPFKCLVVEKGSALLTPPGKIPTYEEQIPVAADHREICRFATPKDKTYRMVIQSIKRIQQGSQIYVTNEFYDVPHSASLQFTGRDDIREQLDESLLPYRNSKTQQRFVLHGLGGSGKTQIALKFAEDNRHSFWGIFWIDASSEDKAKEGFLASARVCKQEEDMETFKAWLSRKDHWLLILDNADNPDLDVSKFFPARDRGTILITTRNPILRDYGNAGNYCVHELFPKDAINLLLKTAAIHDMEAEDTRKSAEKIVRELGYLALAIIQAGAIIRQGLCHLNGFCDLYSSQKKEVLESGRCVSSIDEYQYSVFTTWEISIQNIEEISEERSKLALELLRIFSFMHFDGIREDIFKTAIQNSMHALDVPVFKSSLLVKLMPEWNGLLWGKAMNLLFAFSLITMSDSGLISMHPLVHLWSRERMSVLARADASSATTVILSMSSEGCAGDERKRQLLLPHMDSLLKCEGRQYALSILKEMNEWYRAILNFHSAYVEGGQYQKALKIIQAALNSEGRIWETTDSRFLCLEVFGGQDLNHLGRFRESIKKLEPIMKHLPEGIDPGMVFQTAGCLGMSYNRLEEYHISQDLCTKTMARYEGTVTNDNPAIVSIYTTLGEALSGLKRPKEALIWATKAMLSAQRIHGTQNRNSVMAMEYLAFHYAELKDFRKAYDWQKKSVNCMKSSLGEYHPSTIMGEVVLMNLVAQRRGQLFPRRRIIGRRRELFEKLSQQFGERDCRTLDCHVFLALDYFACGSINKAKVMQEKLVEVMNEEFGKDDKRTTEARNQLARTNKWIAIRKAVYWWLPKRFAEIAGK